MAIERFLSANMCPFYTRLLSNRKEEITTKRARVEKEQWNAGILEVSGKREMSTPLSRFTIVLDVEQPIHLFKKRARDGSATFPCEAPSRILPVGHAMQKVAEASRLRGGTSVCSSGHADTPCPGNKRAQRTSVYTMSERSLKACLQER